MRTESAWIDVHKRARTNAADRFGGHREIPWLGLCVVGCALCHPYLAKVLTQGETAAGAAANGSSAFAALKGLVGKGDDRVTTNPVTSTIDGPIHVTLSVASGGTVLVHEISPEHHTED